MTAVVEILDDLRLNAIKYIVTQKYGYVKDLLLAVRQSIVDELLSIGFIIMGYNADGQTWRVSSSAVDFYEMVK